ncbi:MAG: ABC transporter substrate-binding protein [Anaerolineales bacterium]|nr:ABC transporter substrate-binding protein [Anaerolineales bacterium]
MFKRLSLFLIAAMLIIALVPVVQAQDGGEMMINCGTDEEVTVIVGTDTVGTQKTLMEEAYAEFEAACPNITIKPLDLPESATDRISLYLQFFEAQSSDIDVLLLDVIWPGDLAEHLLDLAPYMSQEEIDAHFPAIIENNTVDGHLVGIPFYTDAGLLYYRADLLEKYGYDAAPATWEELTEMATAIQEGERAEGNAEFWGYVWQGNAYEGLTCDALEWQWSSSDTRIVNPETGEIEVTDPAWIEMLDMAAGWVGTISPPGVIGYQEEDARNVFQQGNAAFMRNWPYAYSLGSAEDSPIAGLFDATVLPSGAAGHGAATLGGWQIAVSKYSSNPDAAAAVAVFMTSEAQQKHRAIVGSYNPTIGSVYQDAEVLEATPIFGSLYDVFVSTVARPSTVSAPQYNQVSTLYFTAVHSVLSGDEDAETAMTLLELDLAELLGE